MDRWAYRDQGWAHVASLAAVVKACAKDGDKVAINILDEAVTELVCSVKAVVQSLTLHGEGILSIQHRITLLHKIELLQM